jgi:hypothetical protein
MRGFLTVLLLAFSTVACGPAGVMRVTNEAETMDVRIVVDGREFYMPEIDSGEERVLLFDSDDTAEHDVFVEAVLVSGQTQTCSKHFTGPATRVAVGYGWITVQ